LKLVIYQARRFVKLWLWYGCDVCHL